MFEKAVQANDGTCIVMTQSRERETISPNYRQSSLKSKLKNEVYVKLRDTIGNSYLGIAHL